MPGAPTTLAELAAMEPGPDRVKAIGDYIKGGEQKIKDARRLRDRDLRDLAAQHGPAETARLTGLSQSTVKIAARG